MSIETENGQDVITVCCGSIVAIIAFVFRIIYYTNAYGIIVPVLVIIGGILYCLFIAVAEEGASINQRSALSHVT